MDSILSLSTPELDAIHTHLNDRLIDLDVNDSQWMPMERFAEFLLGELVRREKNEG